MAAEVNPHGLKVAGTSLNGLALTFFPVSGHRDCDDRTPGLMTYLQGPFEETWMGGAFLVRMFGLRVPVQPNDVVLFNSNLWHEVDSTTGVRFSLVSYCKQFGSISGGLQDTHVPEDIQWVFTPDFGLFGRSSDNLPSCR